MTRRIKIGIDVGGTFTHAVAVDADTLALLGTSMVPTTHRAEQGVARGVVQSMHRLMEDHGIRSDEVLLIAHSTTQATNALLEGDVATVGIVGMGKGLEGWRARGQTNIDDLELAPGKLLRTFHCFLDTSAPLSEARIEHAIAGLVRQGVEVFVTSEAFGIDHPDHEHLIAEAVRRAGYPATAASDISQVYGLRVRTRTAVINASMMPKMLETANMTEQAVRESGIAAPLMVMRSDGGIMSIEEMRRRPILTMLSGPAAGVAAALMYVKISDGVFLEVGGTSTDVSVISNGRPAIRSAEVGGHRLFVRTLDVRTVGIGGGSMPRLRGTRIHDVGPRSAHIAGLRYPSYAGEEECGEPVLRTVQPRQGDPADYLAIAVRQEHSPTFTFTTTEAANALGLIRRYGKAISGASAQLTTWLSQALHTTPAAMSRHILDLAARKVMAVVKDLLIDYKLDRGLLTLVGGGGGAEVVVPHLSGLMQMPHEIADHAEVISAIGAALGMIQDTVERSIVNPSAADLVSLRSEAYSSVLRMGAVAESIDVRVEVDPRQKRVLATARGTPEMRTRTPGREKMEEKDLVSTVARSMRVAESDARTVGATEFLKIYQAPRVQKRLMGLLKSNTTPTHVVDADGVIRLKLSDAHVYSGPLADLYSRIGQLMDDLMIYGDAGGLQPDVYVVVTGRIIDLSGVVSRDQVLSLLRTETEMFGPDEPSVAILSKK